MQRIRRAIVIALLAALTLAGPLPAARAQDSVFPLPATLYILTSDAAVLEVDPLTGAQTMISSDQQPVVDFDIAPDGVWWVYRTWANNATIVETLNGQGGYLLEFNDVSPPPTTARHTIAWSPDVAHIAYLVPGGARIADLGANEFGEAVFTTLGGDWVELYWTGPETLVVLDAGDNGWRITPQEGAWVALPLGANVPRYEGEVISTLTPDGVQIGQGAQVRLVPNTAGALAFGWGPLAPASAFDAALRLPADVYYIAPDTTGADYLWRAPASGAAPVKLVTAVEAQFNYAPAPTSAQVAIYDGNEVAIIDANGGSRRVLAGIPLPPNANASGLGGGLAWRADGLLLAYTDPVGLWSVPVDGSADPQLLVAHSFPTDPAEGFNIRVIGNPKWSPDGSRLLVSIGFYEAGILGVFDLVSQTLIELPSTIAYEGYWTDDGRVLTWAASFGYVTPGLYALDPAQPDAEAQPILGSDTGVLGVARQGSRWIVLATSTPAFGPQYVSALAAESLAGPFVPVSEQGGFVQHARLLASDAIYIIGLRDATYNEYGYPVGQPVIINLETGAEQTILTFGPARDVQWGG